VLPKPRIGRRAGHWVRVIEYTVMITATYPGTGTLTTRTELFRLLTTITTPPWSAPPTWPSATGNDGNQKPATVPQDQRPRLTSVEAPDAGAAASSEITTAADTTALIRTEVVPTVTSSIHWPPLPVNRCESLPSVTVHRRAERHVNSRA
jgi:hypothetical protein